MKRGWIAWAIAVIPMWILFVLCTHWEPVAHDGWGHWMWHRNIGLSPHTLVDFAWGTYTHNNPRLGQVLTMLVYTPGPWHSLVTPIVELGMYYLLAVLVLGRWPSLRRCDDALLFATILAMSALAVPSFGLMLFYRPFTGNYLFGLVISLSLLVPYRLQLEQPRVARWWRTPAMLVLGVATGLCNEHTGPAFAAAIAVAIVVFWRRGERLPWAVAGLIGIVAGGVALYLAPGQAIRYNGLASHASLLGRIAERGVVANLKIIGIAVAWLAWVIPWVVVGVVAKYRDRPAPPPRTRTIAQLALGGMSIAITLTLFLSPKQGFRLYLATMALACAAIAGWVLAQAVARWSRALLVAAAALVYLFVFSQCLPRYYTLGREFRERVRLLDAAPDHGLAVIPVYTIKRSNWSVGDDLLIEPLRNAVSASFRLALVKMQSDQRLTTSPTAPDAP